VNVTDDGAFDHELSASEFESGTSPLIAAPAHETKDLLLFSTHGMARFEKARDNKSQLKSL
jgi:hypothetical protein